MIHFNLEKTKEEIAALEKKTENPDFYSDMESVFEYTHIPAVELEEEDRLALIEGIYVKDREELYSILEGFSS